MPQDGDVVRLDYTLYVDGKPLDTSDAAAASDAGIAREGKRYRPLTVTLGQGQLLPRLEDAVKGAAPGASLTVEVPAKEAYGERDPKRIQDIPMAQFKRQKVQPRVGMEINLQNQRGIVTRVAGGRVRVDLNHELAGKDLRYDLVVREVLTSPTAKVQAVIDALFPSGVPSVQVGEDAVTVELPDAAKFDREWTTHKFRLLGELRAATQGKKAIRLVENYPVLPEPAASGPAGTALPGEEE